MKEKKLQIVIHEAVHQKEIKHFWQQLHIYLNSVYTSNVI